MKIKLTYGELKELLKIEPEQASGGGFQNFLVQLSYRVDDTSGEIDLDDEDLGKINRYATHYGPGGYQSRMYRLFRRTLGARLGWPAE